MLNGCFVNPSSATKLVGGVQVKATPGLAACFLRKPHFTAAALRPARPLCPPSLRSVPGGRPLPSARLLSPPVPSPPPVSPPPQ